MSNSRDRIIGILTSAMGSEIGAVDLLVSAETDDGSAYKLLSDAIEKLMGENTDPNRWDGDEAACSIEAEFLEWLPDIVRHREAYLLRRMNPKWYWFRKSVAKAVADWMDPFERVNDLHGHIVWVRKSDRAEVPWRVIGDEE